MTSLRIGSISYGLPTPGVKRSGVDAFAHRLNQALVARGHDVVAWSYDPAPPDARYPVRTLPAAAFARNWLGRRLTGGYLANVFHVVPRYEDRQVLLVHGDSLFMPLRGIPFLRVMHGSGLGEALSATSPLRKTLQLGVYVQEMTSTLTGRCVAVSENTRRHYPFIRKVIPNGVDTHTFTPGDADKAAEPTVLFVGTLGGRKRGRLLQSWFQTIIRPRLPNARLAMVVEKQGEPMEGVTYHVGVPESTLVELYRRAWVYASPSSYEGFGLPYLEALACGTPVVATPNPGSNEVFADGVAGILADDANFPNAVLKLLEDTDERQRMTELGSKRAIECSFDRTVALYEAELADIAGLPSAGPVPAR